MTDKEILDWIDANPNVKFVYHDHKFFGPHWRMLFGFKSAENRHPDFRSAVRYAKSVVDSESEISEEELQRRNDQVAKIWGTIFQQHSI